jgi:NADPH:quinone reductase-like Zn-dependent oxidoreductase
MKAAITPQYGSADVFETREIPRPVVGEHDVLIEVRASAVTEGDRRLRSADFPTIMALPGRLMVGLTRPKHPVQGTMFAGRVVEVGGGVTKYRVGDDVFGSADHGAYAQYLALHEEAALAKMPQGVNYEEAASVPYGAVTALRFLRDLGSVGAGQRVLVLGASGGVGRFAVQLAKHLGAEVTGVSSRKNLDLVRALGAEHAIDYESEDFTQNGERYDVIFDIADKATFSEVRGSLTERGRYLTLFASLGVLLQMVLTSMGSGPKAKFGVALGEAKDMEELRDLMTRGVLQPVVARSYPLERIAEAHRAVESRQVSGNVVVTMDVRA